MKAKTPNFKSQILNSQQGVTLLLALLILASILAISFSMATIVFIEVRSSSDLLKTEAAFYGAAGVGEQAFFNLTRQVSNPPAYLSAFSNSVILNGQPVTVATGTPILLDKVVPNSDFTHTTNKYDFCNLTATASGCGYGKITLNYVHTGHDNDALYAYLCQWDPSFPIYPPGDPNYGASNSYSSLPCTVLSTSNSVQAYWLGGFNLSGGNQATDGGVQMTGLTSNSVTWTLNPNLQQELILTNPNQGANTIYFSMATFGADGVTPQGLPYVGKTAVVVNTQSGAVSRKVQVTVPNGGTSNGSSGGSGPSCTVTGGTTTTNGGNTIVTFTSSGTFTSSCSMSVQVVVVGAAGGGGGGGGGSGTNTGGGGGGGGGGEARINMPVSVTANTGISVVIGLGGSSGAAGTVSTNGGAGGNGGATSFGSISAAGGGGGVGGAFGGNGGGAGGSGGTGSGGTSGSAGGSGSGTVNFSGSFYGGAGGNGGQSGSGGGTAGMGYGRTISPFIIGYDQPGGAGINGAGGGGGSGGDSSYGMNGATGGPGGSGVVTVTYPTP